MKLKPTTHTHIVLKALHFNIVLKANYKEKNIYEVQDAIEILLSNGYKIINPIKKSNMNPLESLNLYKVYSSYLNLYKNLTEHFTDYKKYNIFYEYEILIDDILYFLRK
jgi:hypothetical protein